MKNCVRCYFFVMMLTFISMVFSETSEIPETSETMQNDDTTPERGLAESDSTVIVMDTEIEYRNPTGAMLRSAVLPGWGQFYNDEPLKGVLYGVVEIGLLAWLIAENAAMKDADETGDTQSYDLHYETRLSLIWYTSGAWLIGMLDAYVDAYLFSFEAENSDFESETQIGAAIYIHF